MEPATSFRTIAVFCFRGGLDAGHGCRGMLESNARHRLTSVRDST